MTADVEAAVRAHLLDEHRDAVEATLDAADAVAAERRGDGADDRESVAGPMRRELERRGVLDAFPSALAGAVDAAGSSLSAAPVPAPPYVVVTGTGPVLRATLPSGRLVIEIRAFEVGRGPRTYRRRPGGPEDALEVEFVGR